MSSAQSRNVAIYGLLGLVLVIAQWMNQAIASSEVDWFASMPAAQYKGLALAILGYVIPGLTLVAAAYRTRVGSEGVAQQVNDLRADGVSRNDMVVLPSAEAARALAASPPLAPTIDYDRLAEAMDTARRKRNQEQLRAGHG